MTSKADSFGALTHEGKQKVFMPQADMLVLRTVDTDIEQTEGPGLKLARRLLEFFKNAGSTTLNLQDMLLACNLFSTLPKQSSFRYCANSHTEIELRMAAKLTEKQFTGAKYADDKIKSKDVEHLVFVRAEKAERIEKKLQMLTLKTMKKLSKKRDEVKISFANGLVRVSIGEYEFILTEAAKNES